MARDFKTCINKIINGYRNDKDGRYKSYEYCRKCFLDNRYYPEKYDLITLNIFAYLASWGMLRKSILLYKEYYFNKEIVKLLCNPEYSCLINFDPFGPNAKNNIKPLIDLRDKIVDYYKNKEYVKYGQQKTYYEVSEILVTKILLGTLGCVPAYDTNFKSGLDEYFGKEEVNKNGLKKFEESSMNVMVDFAIKNKKEIENACKELDQLSGVKGLYTPMKIIDMYFFEVGLEAKKQKNKQQTNKQNP